MYLGIDIGSLYLSIVLMNEDGKVVKSIYEPHKGSPLAVLQSKLQDISLADVLGCAKTGSGSKKITGIGSFIDPVVAQLDGVRTFTGDAKNIIVIGAGSFTLIRTNDRGEYLKHTSNSACASGTGAFLDQQAMRLKFKPEELPAKAECAKNCPSVATRCAVFAKSDIIHLQQEGFLPEDIAAGLCHGLGRSAIDQLLQGRQISGKTVMVGGVAKNSQVVKSVAKRLNMPINVPECPELIGAIGAALYAKGHGESANMQLSDIQVMEEERKKVLRAPLELKHSNYPDFTYHDFYIDETETETAIIKPLEDKAYSVALGIDIGSTSTKCTLMTTDKEMLAIYYTATRGNPIKAIKNLFKAISASEKKNNVSFNVVGVGTTGSGRKFIKKVINADTECDEITAHAKAATFIDPNVDTILELGGQDAKFTQLQNGVVYNSIMNYVCAAGTGSFIEEQAKKLGISVWDYADFVMGEEAPFTSDRCTVFMERDLETLMTAGYTKKEIASSVLFSVRDNYLNKVVGGFGIGKHVYFQGATARNKALVAAFEQEIGRPISVSPYCHVTGAMGMSLSVIERNVQNSSFCGFGFAEEETVTTTENCELCSSQCTTTVVTTGSEEVKWGFKCGRDDDDDGPVRRKLPEYDLFKFRNKLLHTIGKKDIEHKRGVVTAPMSLTTFEYAPFWRAFFAELDYELILSPLSTSDTMVAGEQLKTAEFCAPVVLALGQARSAFALQSNFYFMPYMIREQKTSDFSNSHFCPHVQSYPSLIKALFPEIDDKKMLCPVFDRENPERYTTNMLFKEFGLKMDIRAGQVKRALRAGVAANKEFQTACLDAGIERLKEIEKSDKMGVVVVGRPYNTVDPILSLNLPKKIAEKGIVVFPVEFVPAEPKKSAADWPNMYWTYGQRILSAARTISNHKNLFGVFLTSFSCGPDSYLLSYFKDIMAEVKKPYLTLQLDAHGADAGYLTRIEAAIEAFKAWEPKEKKTEVVRGEVSGALKNVKTVFVPAMDPIICHLFAGAFRRFGYESKVVEENQETLAYGLKHCSGGECMPCPSTLGGFIHAIKSSNIKPENAALFMPTTDGPCRFGQYNVLHSIALKKLGMEKATILSPSSQNAYQGLPPKLRKLMWDAIVVGDVMHKVVNKIRPYEINTGETDAVLARYRKLIEEEFAKDEKKADLPGVFGEFVKTCKAIKTERFGTRPLIGVVGEIYVRCSEFSNNNVIKEIENLGGEAFRTSTAEWILYTGFLQKYLTKGTFKIKERLEAYLKNKFFHGREAIFVDIARDIIRDRIDPDIEKVVKAGGKYVPYEYQTEAILTFGRSVLMIEEENVKAIVNVAPTFCMPGVFTSSMFFSIEEKYGVPVICNFYDGSGDPNAALVPHLHYLRERLAKEMGKITQKTSAAAA